MDERAYTRRQLKNYAWCMAGYFVMLRYLTQGMELKRRHRAEVLTLTIAGAFLDDVHRPVPVGDPVPVQEPWPGTDEACQKGNHCPCFDECGHCCNGCTSDEARSELDV